MLYFIPCVLFIFFLFVYIVMCRDVSRIQATPHTGHRESGHPRQCLQPGREDLSLLSLQDAESQQLYEGD